MIMREKIYQEDAADEIDVFDLQVSSNLLQQKAHAE